MVGSVTEQLSVGRSTTDTVFTASVYRGLSRRVKYVLELPLRL